jgi:hypothetical protein
VKPKIAELESSVAPIVPVMKMHPNAMCDPAHSQSLAAAAAVVVITDAHTATATDTDTDKDKDKDTQIHKHAHTHTQTHTHRHTQTHTHTHTHTHTPSTVSPDMPMFSLHEPCPLGVLHGVAPICKPLHQKHT